MRALRSRRSTQLGSALGGGRCAAAVRERWRDVAEGNRGDVDRDVDERRMPHRRQLGQRRSAADRGTDEAEVALRVDERALALATGVLAEVRNRVRVRGRLRESEQ